MKNHKERKLGFGAALVFALLFNAILWTIETLVFFAQKIANPRIWFYLPWKSLVLYLAAAVIFFLVAFTLSRISLRRKRETTHNNRVFIRGYLVLTLLAYFLSLYFIKFRPRLAPHWYHFPSLAALLIVTAGTIGLATILSGLIAIRIGPRRSLRVMGWIAIAAIPFFFFNIAFDINEMTIPRVTQEKTTPGPNLVMIFVDALRPDFLGCYGNPDVRTPHIDRLASAGIIFKDCISQAPWTLPGLGSILTSKYPSQHGAERQRILDAKTGQELETLRSGWLGEANLTLFEILKKNGYTNAVFQPNITASSFLGFDQGVDFFFDAFKNRGMIFEEAVSALTLNRINDALYPRFLCADNRKVIAYAKRWLKKNENSKFCVFLMLFDIHEYYLDIVGYKNRFLVNKDSHRGLSREGL